MKCDDLDRMALKDKEAEKPINPSFNSYSSGARLVQKVWSYSRITRYKPPEITTARILEIEQYRT